MVVCNSHTNHVLITLYSATYRLSGSYLAPGAADPGGTAIGGALLSVRRLRPLAGRGGQRAGRAAGLQALAGHLPPAPAVAARHRALGPHGHRPAEGGDGGVKTLGGMKQGGGGAILERFGVLELGHHSDKKYKQKNRQITKNQIANRFDLLH